MTLPIDPHQPSLAPTREPVEASESTTDLKPVDPQFGPHRTLTTPWLEQHKQGLSKEDAGLIDHVVAALAGRVAVMHPFSDAEGGRFQLAQPFQKAELVTFGANSQGVIDHLEISGSNMAAQVSIGRCQSTEEPPAKRLKTGLNQGRITPRLPSSGLLHPDLYDHSKDGQKSTHDAAEHEVPSPEDPSRVRMKLKDHNQRQFSGGVGQSNLAIAEMVQRKYGDVGMPRQPQLAKQGEDGIWRGAPSDHLLALDKLDGRFIYVTMLDGQIRLGNAINGQNAHTQLSGNAKDVRYAGTVTFSDGRIQSYTNESGTYVPPAALRYQAGLNQGAGFGAVGHPFVPITAQEKTEAQQAFEQMIRSRVKQGL